jgi:hypothetical protein
MLNGVQLRGTVKETGTLSAEWPSFDALIFSWYV